MAGNAGKKRKLDPNAQKYYAVRCGAKPGVYLTWPECQKQIAGFKGASYKSFLSREEADDFCAGKETASDETENRFYAVARGRKPGIYTRWEEASEAITGWKGPKYKKFETRPEAIDFINLHGNDDARKWLAEEAGEEGFEPPAKKTKKAAAAAAPIEDDEDVVKVYTDGSSRSNGKVGAMAGVGVFFGPQDKRNVSERLQGEVQTNQRAELTAMLRALEKVPKTQKLRIYSDSKYSIQCVSEWHVNWQKNGWKTSTGEDVKNKDLVMAIRKQIDARQAAGTGTSFQWVKGHANDPGNVAADKLAVEGALMRK